MIDYKGRFLKSGSFVVAMLFVLLFMAKGAIAQTRGADVQGQNFTGATSPLTYSQADLVGKWEGNSLANGPSAPWWERASITIAADGSFTGVAVESNGYSEPASGIFIISPDGIVTLTGKPNVHCSMDSGKTVLVCTDKKGDGSGRITAFTKKSASYSLADLVGKWDVNSLASGPGAPWWSRGTITIASNGAFTGTLVDFYDESWTLSGTFIVSTSGIVTCSSGCGDSAFRCTMDAGKSVLACTNTWDYPPETEGTTEMMILTKKASSYSMADLAGVWGVHNLATDDAGNTWSLRGTITILGDGSASGVLQESSKSSAYSWTGSFGISSNGIVTCLSGCTFQCSMDSGKTLISCTETQSDGSSAMPIFTKQLTTAGNTSPALGALTPSALVSAPGIVQTFTAKYNDADGYEDIKQAYFRVHTLANGIYLRYDRTTNKLYLYDDAGKATVGSCTPGAAKTLTNSQGSLICAATTVAGSGNTLTIKWKIKPRTAPATKRDLYMLVSDTSNAKAGWTDKGDWTIGVNNAAPTLGTLTPSVLVSAPGIAKTFTAIYSDADGYEDIKQAYLRVHTKANGIYLRYDRTTNNLYLYDDAGTAPVGSCTPGAAKILTNTQGSLNCAATIVLGSDNNLTIKWSIKPKSAYALSTKKDLYMLVNDISGLTAGWTDKGDWTIKP